MKMLFSIDSMYKGGAERVMANLCNYFSSDNEVTLVYMNDHGINYPLNQNISTFCLDSYIKNNQTFLKKNFIRLRFFRKLVHQKKPNVIISFLPRASFMTLFCNLFNRRKIIISVRNDPKKEFNSRIKRLCMQILYRRANGFVFQTREAQTFFPHSMIKKSTIIFNPVADSFFEEVYSGIREKKIVTVGRLELQKNQRLLIEAFSTFHQGANEYQLLIYGEGVERQNLEEYIASLGMSKYIHLMGNVENVKDSIKKASVFVLSSDFEGMPNALMEALALGIPCVSTDCPCGGPASLITTGENGILVPIQDVHAMTEALKKITNDDKMAKKFTANCMLRREAFRMEKVLGAWKQFIMKTIGG